MKEIVISPRLLIRLNKKGLLDEVVTHDENGDCDFHLEQMDDFQWWMRWSSTNARPLARELIVDIGPSGAIQSFEPPPQQEDEKYLPVERKMPPEKIAQELGKFIQYFGMSRMLTEMISNIKSAIRDEKTNWPDRDVGYLEKLANNLSITLKEYEQRYPGEPDYSSDEAPQGE